MLHPYTRQLRRNLQEELNRALSMVLTWTPEDLKVNQGRVQILTEIIADISPEENK